MRKITNKAKNIYEATKRDCRQDIKIWGYNIEIFVGDNTLII